MHTCSCTNFHSNTSRDTLLLVTSLQLLVKSLSIFSIGGMLWRDPSAFILTASCNGLTLAPYVWPYWHNQKLKLKLLAFPFQTYLLSVNSVPKSFVKSGGPCKRAYIYQKNNASSSLPVAWRDCFMKWVYFSSYMYSRFHRSSTFPYFRWTHLIHYQVLHLDDLKQRNNCLVLKNSGIIKYSCLLGPIWRKT